MLNKDNDNTENNQKSVEDSANSVGVSTDENKNAISNDESKEEISLDDLTEKLKTEAKEYLKLTNSYKQNKYMNDEKEGYLISKKWLDKWKGYVDYETIKEQSQNYRFSSKKQYTVKPEEKPGSIDNTLLLIPQEEYYHDDNPEDIENQVIRHDIDQSAELKIVNEEIWNFFHSRYGGGPKIVKPMITEEGRFNNRKVFEVYYGKYNIVVLPTRKNINKKLDNLSDADITDSKLFFISRTKNLEDMKEKIINVCLKKFYQKELNDLDKIKTKNLRLWRYTGLLEKDEIIKMISQESENIKQGNLVKPSFLTYCEHMPNTPLKDFEVEDTDTLIVEVNMENIEDAEFEKNWIFEVEKIEMKKTKCDWCGTFKFHRVHCACKEVWYCSETCKIKDTNYHEGYCKKRFEIDDADLKMTSKSKKGIVGLQNLGNTCFMNSSLQCISNCYELAQYFLTDSYKKDINTDNPLGTQGALSRSYANLLKELYYGESSYYSPRNFKRAIATFQSMFTGYQQHDSQEFLNYLLDGLHEDQNRVIKKPFIEKDESNKEDSIKAKDQWIGFLRRNQSVLVDILYGQYKSTITCPCSNISTTFDPYLSISLPLANRVQAYEITCFFIFYDLNIVPIQINLMFNTKTTIMALRNKISKIMDIHPYSFLVTKMDSRGNIDNYCHSRSALFRPSHHSHSNQKAYFLFQYGPEDFVKYSTLMQNEDLSKYNTDYPNMLDYLNKNKERNVKIFDSNYEEEENCSDKDIENYYSTSNYFVRGSSEKALIKYNTDSNYGFPEDYLIVQSQMYGVATNSSDRESKVRLIFPRVHYFSKSWSSLTVTKKIFDYFYPVIKKTISEVEEGSPLLTNFDKALLDDKEKLFEYFYSDYDSSPENDDNEYFKKKNIPFRIYMNTHYHIKDRDNVFNGQTRNSSDEGFVLFPISEETLGSFVDKVPQNANKMYLDNTFNFMNEHNKFYSNMNNRDFYFQILWNPEYNASIKKLNDKVDFDFKIAKKLKESIDLDECFKHFCKEEQLEEGNEWYCSACKQHTKARKHMELYSTPPVMIIHLKRFKANNKIDTQVDFPVENLDMSKYIIGENKDSNNNMYDLFAVSHHYGGMGGGHYVASCKNHFDGKWYHFNDSSVSPERESDITASSAYVLFYKRKNIHELDLQEIYNRKFIDYTPPEEQNQ